jgi:hypothetical protein
VHLRPRLGPSPPSVRAELSCFVVSFEQMVSPSGHLSISAGSENMCAIAYHRPVAVVAAAAAAGERCEGEQRR